MVRDWYSGSGHACTCTHHASISEPDHVLTQACGGVCSVGTGHASLIRYGHGNTWWYRATDAGDAQKQSCNRADFVAVTGVAPDPKKSSCEHVKLGVTARLPGPMPFFVDRVELYARKRSIRPFMCQSCDSCSDPVTGEPYRLNLGRNHTAKQSSTATQRSVAGAAVDGKHETNYAARLPVMTQQGGWQRNGSSCTRSEKAPWWQVDLARLQPLHSVRVAAAAQAPLPAAAATIWMHNGDQAKAMQCGRKAVSLYPGAVFTVPCHGSARFVLIRAAPPAGAAADSTTVLALSEVWVYGAPACPVSCFVNNGNVSTLPRAVHQLAVSTNGFADAVQDPAECSLGGARVGTAACDGGIAPVHDSLPSASINGGRLKGARHRGYFVAPKTANYTFMAGVS